MCVDVLCALLGAGNCLGLLASKTSPTAVRGQFYGIAAAIGKIGAFVGTWAFPPMIDGRRLMSSPGVGSVLISLYHSIWWIRYRARKHWSFLGWQWLGRIERPYYIFLYQAPES